MVFTTRTSSIRTIPVRILIGLVVVSVVSILTLFKFAESAPVAPCDEQCLNTTYNDEATPERYIALTFDDGPTPEYTDQILSILDKHGVHATFFVLGEKVMRNPDIVSRVYEAGHEIGNHSFTHSRQVHANEERIQWELAETNRLIEAITGHSALMYRPPYLTDLEHYEVIPPIDSKPVWGWVYEAGYLTVGSDIDTDDWRSYSRKATAAHARKAITMLEDDSDGMTRRIMLFHDTPQTAATLDKTLTILEEKGYQIVPLSALLGLTRDEVMPKAGTTLATASGTAVMRGLGILLPLLTGLVVFVTAVTTARFIGFMWFKGRRIRRKTITSPARLMPRFGGRVTVLIPAWNESENVKATVQSVLNNTRQPDEVIVIDDGSTDDTLMHAKRMAAVYPNVVKTLTKENGGKSSALNYGLTHVTGDVVIAIDGDTVLDPECIDAVARAFADPRVGAVAGKIVPANTNTLLEKYQHLEYLIGQNMDKEVVSALGSVNIVPGAVGAWRRDIITQVGGYSEDTLVEDQDLTLAVLGEGYKVVYVPEAVAYTEVPTKIRSFYLQRFRWTYGTFQCVWKYRHYLMEPGHLRLGWIALPYALTFNIILPVVSLGLLLALLLGIVLQYSYPALWFLIFFTLLDMTYGYVALWNEDVRSRRFLVHMPLQRFAYQGIYAVLISMVLLKVLDGSRTRWTHLVRTGSAQAFFENTLTKLTPETEPTLKPTA